MVPGWSGAVAGPAAHSSSRPATGIAGSAEPSNPGPHTSSVAPRVADDVVPLGGGAARVERHEHHPGPRRGDLEHQVLDRVAGQYRAAVARAEAGQPQPPRGARARVAGLRPRRPAVALHGELAVRALRAHRSTWSCSSIAQPSASAGRIVAPRATGRSRATREPATAPSVPSAGAVAPSRDARGSPARRRRHSRQRPADDGGERVGAAGDRCSGAESRTLRKVAACRAQASKLAAGTAGPSADERSSAGSSGGQHARQRRDRRGGRPRSRGVAITSAWSSRPGRRRPRSTGPPVAGQGARTANVAMDQRRCRACGPPSVGDGTPGHASVGRRVPWTSSRRRRAGRRSSRRRAIMEFLACRDTWETAGGRGDP